MKANELMIGDWVLVNGTQVQVEAIDENKFIAYFSLDAGGLLAVDKFEHIPLTPKILEKNGWKKLDWKNVKYHPGLTSAYKMDDYIIQIGYNESIGKYDIFDGFISFRDVHELQHALRLCGLNELADNFKI